jgi:hypothetical protein
MMLNTGSTGRRTVVKKKKLGKIDENLEEPWN